MFGHLVPGIQTKVTMEKLAYIEKLQGKENYQDWVFSVGLALRGADAYGVVDGTLAVKDPKYARKNNLAMYHIGSTVSVAVIPIIREKATAVEMWKALEEAFSPVDEYKKAQLNTEFWTFQVVPGETMVSTIARLNNLVADLGKQNESISNATKMMRLLAALPVEYGSFRSAWDSTPDAERVYTKLCQRLIVEEERRGLSVSVGQQSEALSTRTRQCTCQCKCGAGGSAVVAERRGPRERRRSWRVRCYQCDELGHMKRDCPQRSNSVRKSEALCTSTVAAMNTNQWCMDTGATDHMCPVKRLFQRYQALDEPRAVWTAGGHKLIAKGIGDVPVLAFNGQAWVKKVLTEVLYVPGSQHFLMSMAKTLDRGCRVLADGDSVRFTRDDETVAIGQRKGPLFYMLFREWDRRDSGSCGTTSRSQSRRRRHGRLGHRLEKQVGSVCQSKKDRGGVEQRGVVRNHIQLQSTMSEKRLQSVQPRVSPTSRIMQKMMMQPSGQKKFTAGPSAGDKRRSGMGTAGRQSVMTGEDQQKRKEVMAPVDSGQSSEILCCKSKEMVQLYQQFLEWKETVDGKDRNVVIDAK